MKAAQIAVNSSLRDSPNSTERGCQGPRLGGGPWGSRRGCSSDTVRSSTLVDILDLNKHQSHSFNELNSIYPWTKLALQKGTESMTKNIDKDTQAFDLEDEVLDVGAAAASSHTGSSKTAITFGPVLDADLLVPSKSESR